MLSQPMPELGYAVSSKRWLPEVANGDRIHRDCQAPFSGRDRI
jgi:hypothetical protein